MSLTDEPLYCEHGISNLSYCLLCARDEWDEPLDERDEDDEYDYPLSRAD